MTRDILREFTGESTGFEPSCELLATMIKRDRLKESSDSPLDLTN